MVEGQLHDILVVSRRFEDKRMNLFTQEIRKNPEGLAFDQELDLLKDLQKRNSEILDLKNVTATGRVAYDTGLYVLDYQLSYTIVLASSRSMEPVELQESYPVTEVFAEDVQSDADIEALEEDLILPIEGGKIDLSESVADNILLNIPLQKKRMDKVLSKAMIGKSYPKKNTKPLKRLRKKKTVLSLVFKDYLTKNKLEIAFDKFRHKYRSFL